LSGKRETQGARLRAAVVGLGSFGKHHVRVLRSLPEVLLVAGVDPSASARESVQSVGTQVYADAAQMLREQAPDIVFVATPAQLHCELTCAALRAGAHVFVEKPMALTVIEGERMIAQAKACGRQLMVGHLERYNPSVIALRQALSAGTYGKAKEVHARRTSPKPSRMTDVGVTLDYATHDLDLMHYLTGAALSTAVARGVRDSDGLDLEISASLTFANGVYGTLLASWLCETAERTFEVHAEHALITADLLRKELRVRALGCANAEVIETALGEPLTLEIQAFVNAVGLGQPVPVSGAAGLQALEAAVALMNAASRVPS
jgi:UDP-N-acetylglucosamine 3-dehydrogenase